MAKFDVLVELILATDKTEYKDALCSMSSQVDEAFGWSGWTLELLDLPAHGDLVVSHEEAVVVSRTRGGRVGRRTGSNVAKGDPPPYARHDDGITARVFSSTGQ